jgi:hypothetical protein
MRCLGCIQGIPVSIGEITVHVKVIVVCECGLVLGRPFMEASMMALTQKRDGNIEYAVYNPERSRKVTFPSTARGKGRS